MRHFNLTCTNHPELRWTTKSCAWSIDRTHPNGGWYNGSRNIFFVGSKTECECPAACLTLAPEETGIDESERPPIEQGLYNLAEFILCWCIYEAFRVEGISRDEALCDRTFQSRMRYWRVLKLDEIDAEMVRAGMASPPPILRL